MGIFNAVFIYLLLWWLTLFTVLPIGVQREDSVEKGCDAGAPKFHNLKKKLILTSLISAGILAVIEILVEMRVIDFHAWFEGK